MLTKQKILDSLEYVVKQSSYVSIESPGLNDYLSKFEPTPVVHWNEVGPLGYRPRPNKDEEIDFLFILGSQAFCFWGYPKKWTIEVNGILLDGWWACIAALERALQRGLPILDGNYLAKLTLEETKEIFAGDTEIPLIEERHKILVEIGKTLKKRYGGYFHNFYNAFKADPFLLLERIGNEFEGFNDVVKYKGRDIYFYKKAQLILIDINYLVEPVIGIEDLPGLPDYKVPAVLRKKEILKYKPELEKLVDSRKEIPAGSEMEVEIRGNMLWVVNDICRRLKVKDIEVIPVDLANILWIESQEKSPFDKPYHLTRTVFY